MPDVAVDKRQDSILSEEDKKQLSQRKKTVGEKVFDRTVYTGVGFGLNELISVIFAVEFEHGKNKILGKESFGKVSDWMVRTFKFKDKVKNGKTISAKVSAGNTLLWTSLTSGGFILLLPMKWMEDNKAKMVKWLNHKFDKGSLTQDQVAARDAEVDRAIACEPGQTWGSLLLGRFVAIGASIGLGTMLGEERSEKIKDFSDKVLTKGTKAVGLEGLTKTRNFHNYTKIIGVETVSCATSSTVLEVASKFFARNKPVVKDPELCAAKDSLKSQPIEKRDSSYVAQARAEDSQVVQQSI